jgi:ElaB/YqjD/DUF883 family membrane-anchored ribosome-binding protein
MNQDIILKNLANLIDETIECSRQVCGSGEPSEQFEKIIGQTEGNIRKHPVKSVAIGIVGGFVIGKFLS